MTTTMVAGRECVLGCDVSRWQGGINYGVFNLDFVVAKASGGDGGLYRDPKWLANASGFLAEDVPLGTYHFAGRADPVTEANFFANVILDSPWADAPSHLKMPPTLDAEWTNPSFGAGAADWSLRFLGRLGDRTGVHPNIYTAKWVGLEPDPRLLAYDFWLAAYVANPDAYPCPPWGTNWSIWQNSSTGSVSGIAGNCDTDAARADWFARVLGGTPPTPSPEELTVADIKIIMDAIADLKATVNQDHVDTRLYMPPRCVKVASAPDQYVIVQTPGGLGRQHVTGELKTVLQKAFVASQLGKAAGLDFVELTDPGEVAAFEALPIV